MNRSVDVLRGEGEAGRGEIERSRVSCGEQIVVMKLWTLVFGSILLLVSSFLPVCPSV